jgi:DNA-binding winged helix-turn-helix (wHTH) protein
MRVDFERFTLDDEQRQLLEDGAPVHLSLKAYELLKLLLQERPRAIAKAELHERLWPDAFVSDATLASLVAEVRSALGEPARGSRFIRTVHGFGYGFQGEAIERGTPSPPGAGQPAAATSTHWLSGDKQQFPLKEGENVIGRDREADVHLEALSVSRWHARVTVAGEQVVLEDLGSKNGTYLRGARLRVPATLQDGDPIRVGAIPLTFRTLTAAPPTITQG